MKVVSNFTQEKPAGLAAAVWGSILAFFITLVSFVVFALLIAYTPFPEGLASVVVILTTVVSLLFGGAFCARKAGSHGLRNGLVVGVLYAAVTYLISSLVFQSFSVHWNMLVMLVLCVFSSTVGGILGVNFRKKRRRHA